MGSAHNLVVGAASLNQSTFFHLYCAHKRVDPSRSASHWWDCISAGMALLGRPTEREHRERESASSQVAISLFTIRAFIASAENCQAARGKTARMVIVKHFEGTI